MQKMRVQFAKRGRLRFTSHRDFQRAFERALRRADVPMAYSHGFTPHPKISFVGAAPTGAASEAEYLEISLTARRDPEQVRASLDSALPPGLDILSVSEVELEGRGSLADQLQASSWLIELPGAAVDDVRGAVDALMAADSVEVQRLTKKGTRTLDARAAVLHARVVVDEDDRPADEPALRLVIEHQTPTVRPEEILGALREVADFEPPTPPRVTRLAQGTWNPAHQHLTPPK
ncbi:DUF2344 domain-containing protein [Phytoactinopolyspora halotolerans]|uniref:DUF2344 domain-containing protein n=1 Tax=Phytoactinopolyspora halotolerans TaxID=1981512 RepID=A0A6L9S7E5_9ACTN|nr:DUF2344 domain-containing protein [Phytoactinopolyspora halotolerans]